MYPNMNTDMTPRARLAALVLPPRLDGAEAEAAIDAYLALPPFTDPAPAAERAARAARLQALLTVLPTESFPRLFATLATRAGKAEGGLRRRAFKVWVERDPAAVARWAVELVPSPALDAYTRNDYLAKSVEAWAELDFDAAFAWSSTLADAKLRNELAGGLLARIAANDPARALALAAARGGELLAGTGRAIFEAWAKTDPAAAIRRLGDTLSAEDTRRWEFHDALTKWAKLDPGAVLDWSSARELSHPGSLTISVESLIDQIIDDSDATRALADAIKARPELPNGVRSLTRLMIHWSRKDSKAALAWIDTVADTNHRSGYLIEALNNGAGRTLEDRLALVHALPAGPGRDEQLSRVLTIEAGRDPDAALAWLQEHDDPSLAPVAAKVQSVLIGKLAATDLSSAVARWNELPADANKLEAARGIAANWATTDPAVSSRWLGEQLFSPTLSGVNADASPQILIGVVSRWIKQDPVAAAAWIGTLPESEIRQRSLESFTAYYTQTGERRPNPEVAATFARIEDAAVRDAILSDHLKNWLRFDVHAATAWIEANDALSPEKAAELLTTK